MVHKNTGYRVFHTLNILIMIFIGIVAVYPYWNVMVVSLNEGMDSMKGGLMFLPRALTLQNFSLIIENSTTAKAAFISVARVLSGTLIALIVQFSAGYAFTRKGLLGRKALLIFLIIPMFFGGGLIPQYLLYSKLHMLNNFSIYIIPGAFSFYNMVIIRTFINTIPTSLEESARLDGANEVIILARIILPLSLPIVATVSLWTAVGYWNDWITTLYFITNPRFHTLQFILVQMIQESERIGRMLAEELMRGNSQGGKFVRRVTPESLRAAQVVVTTLPIILIYPFLQKYFIKGVMLGSIKE